MFVQLPSRTKSGLRWATPLVFAALWCAFLWISTRAPTTQRMLLEDWGALTGGPGLPETWHALWSSLRWKTLFTAIFLLIFGLPAERAMGPWRFLALFLIGGAVANLATVLMIGTPERLVIGASGAVAAVIGAYLALFPRAKLGVVVPLGLFLEFIRAPASLLIGVWAALQVVFAYIGPAFGAVAWNAHIAGFLFGIVFAMLARAGIERRLRHVRNW